MEAYILINTEASVSWQVAEAVLKIEGVKTGHVVTGQFDAVALVQFSEVDDLMKIIARIQHVKGVLRTQTLLTVPSPTVPSPSRTVDVMPSLAEEEKTGPDNYPDR